MSNPALPPPVDQGSAGPPVCPRHPDRVAYVRCQRCNRPVCPQCQRPAAVGVQCVDCVNADAKVRAAGAPRSALGAPLRGGKPIVTIVLIGLCVIAFVAQQVLGNQFTFDLAFIPILGWSQPYRFITSAFLHYGVMHLLLNMYALWVVGSFLEQILGRWRYIALYLICGLGGSVGMLVWAAAANTNQAWTGQSAGASGAIFGLFGAILLVTKRLGRDARGILIVIGINVVLGFVVSNIAWQAHFGGLITGLALGSVYAWAPRAHRTLFSVTATVAVPLALIGVALLCYS